MILEIFGLTRACLKTACASPAVPVQTRPKENGVAYEENKVYFQYFCHIPDYDYSRFFHLVRVQHIEPEGIANTNGKNPDGVFQDAAWTENKRD